MKVIEIVVDPKGQTILQTKGFAGPSCRDASRLLEAALGRVVWTGPRPNAISRKMHTPSRTSDSYRASASTFGEFFMASPASHATVVENSGLWPLRFVGRTLRHSLRRWGGHTFPVIVVLEGKNDVEFCGGSSPFSMPPMPRCPTFGRWGSAARSCFFPAVASISQVGPGDWHHLSVGNSIFSIGTGWKMRMPAKRRPRYRPPLGMLRSSHSQARGGKLPSSAGRVRGPGHRNPVYG